MKRPPTVDDADVDELVDIVRKHADFTVATPEVRADAVADAARLRAQLLGYSKEWSAELARRVRAKMLWAKPSSD